MDDAVGTDRDVRTIYIQSGIGTVSGSILCVLSGYTVYLLSIYNSVDVSYTYILSDQPGTGVDPWNPDAVQSDVHLYHTVSHDVSGGGAARSGRVALRLFDCFCCIAVWYMVFCEETG